MELKQNKNQIKVIGDDIYLDPSDMNISYGVYRWEDSITLDVLVGLDHNSDIIELKYSENLHSKSEDCNILDIKKDGLYKIIHYVLPIKDWVDRANLPEDIYFYDESKYYLRSNNIDEEVTIEDILNEDIYLDERTIFIDYFIKRCFSEIIKKIISVQKDCNSRSLESLKEQRDLAHMFINVIQYSLEFGKILEAQLYMEKFFKCNAICNKHISEISNYDCGCK